MSLNNITRGDMLRTAGRTSLVVGVRRTANDIAIDLVDFQQAGGATNRPVTVSIELLRQLAACGVDVRIIRGVRPPRIRTRCSRGGSRPARQLRRPGKAA